MSLLKPNLFLVIIMFFFSTNSLAEVNISGLNCLFENFQVEIKNKRWAGLLKNELSINKKECIIDIEVKKYWFYKKSWKIDVCRRPVHIKDGYYDTSNVKRFADNCTENAQPYCKSFVALKNEIENEGLVYAQGVKEDLSSTHGKIYCSYLLLNSYLEERYVFSTFNKQDFNLADKEEKFFNKTLPFLSKKKEKPNSEATKKTISDDDTKNSIFADNKDQENINLSNQKLKEVPAEISDPEMNVLPENKTKVIPSHEEIIEESNLKQIKENTDSAQSKKPEIKKDKSNGFKSLFKIFN